jgi:hypothetical protein
MIKTSFQGHTLVKQFSQWEMETIIERTRGAMS